MRNKWFFGSFALVSVFLASFLYGGQYVTQERAANSLITVVAVSTTTPTVLTTHNTVDRKYVSVGNISAYYLRVSTDSVQTTYAVYYSSAPKYQSDKYYKALYGLIVGSSNATENVNVIEEW